MNDPTGRMAERRWKEGRLVFIERKCTSPRWSGGLASLKSLISGWLERTLCQRCVAASTRRTDAIVSAMAVMTWETRWRYNRSRLYRQGNDKGQKMTERGFWYLSRHKGSKRDPWNKIFSGTKGRLPHAAGSIPDCHDLSKIIRSLSFSQNQNTCNWENFSKWSAFILFSIELAFI